MKKNLGIICIFMLIFIFGVYWTQTVASDICRHECSGECYYTSVVFLMRVMDADLVEMKGEA